VTIPANTMATIYIPAHSADAVQENGQALSEDKDLVLSGMEEGYLKVKVGSGHYKFTSAQ